MTAVAPGVGHNGGPPLDDKPATGGIAADRLRSLVSRIERLDEERKAITTDIRDIYGEAKSAGFDVKALRRVIADRKKDAAALEELESLAGLYHRAIS